MAIGRRRNEGTDTASTEDTPQSSVDTLMSQYRVVPSDNPEILKRKSSGRAAGPNPLAGVTAAYKDTGPQKITVASETEAKNVALWLRYDADHHQLGLRGPRVAPNGEQFDVHFTVTARKAKATRRYTSAQIREWAGLEPNAKIPSEVRKSFKEAHGF